eukprot:355371-Chlamydomonas_euryale.AAC.6
MPAQLFRTGLRDRHHQLCPVTSQLNSPFFATHQPLLAWPMHSRRKGLGLPRVIHTFFRS